MRAPDTVAVLVYHSIAARTTPSFAELTVDPGLFDEHLAALRECACSVIPFRRVPDALTAGAGGQVTISIDDGLADAASNAVPALARHGMAATLFVPSGFVGQQSRWLRGADADRPMLGWADLADLAEAGFEIGSHGRRHLAADINPVGMVRRDAAASRMELEDHLGMAVPSFAYPFGYHSGPARRAIREAGFAQACVVGDLPARGGDDRWALPRLQVQGGMTPEALLELVRWRPAPPARAWAHAKQRVWRAGRRWAGWGPPEAGRADEPTS
jgi:peptidoglycan/xylan/chitin deacetylase (PgdA/CDA1 family)